MKRDPRLHGLSSDHQHALHLAWEVKQAFTAGTADAALLVRAQSAFASELAPHFAVEEEVLLAALDVTGAADARALADRTRREHAEIRAELAAAASGDLARLAAFGRCLTAHVRFEENDLFPACERLLAAEVLEEAARRAPKSGPRPADP